MPIKNRKAQASRPVASHVLQGKVSWFGGPHDSSDSGHTASGVTTAVPGIAVYDHSTLGGYWKVTTHANGRTHVEKQTDIGPAPWTGRVLDITYSALSHFGFTESNFPTDSQITAVYLGKDRAAAMQAGGVPSQDPVGSVATAAGGTPGGGTSGTGTTQNVDLLSTGGDILSILTDLVTGNISDLAGKLALAGLAITREVAVGFFDLIIAPAWHWNQRVVAYYSDNVIDLKSVADGASEFQWGVAWTAAFWGGGYVLLWTEPGSGKLKPVPVHRTRLGRHVRHAQAVPARRSLIKPRDVREHTPKKPKEHISVIEIRLVDTMQTSRQRTVRVHGSRTDTATRSGTPEAASEVPVQRVRTEDAAADAAKSAQPDAHDTSGKGASKNS